VGQEWHAGQSTHEATGCRLRMRRVLILLTWSIYRDKNGLICLPSAAVHAKRVFHIFDTKWRQFSLRITNTV